MVSYLDKLLVDVIVRNHEVVAALKEAFRIVGHNCGLDISGEYGSIEIESNEFEADSKLQDEMNHKYESVTSEGDLRSKERLKTPSVAFLDR